MYVLDNISVYSTCVMARLTHLLFLLFYHLYNLTNANAAEINYYSLENMFLLARFKFVDANSALLHDAKIPKFEPNIKNVVRLMIKGEHETVRSL